MKFFRKIVKYIISTFVALFAFATVTLANDVNNKMVAEMNTCYQWNPVLWDYILKKEDVREFWRETSAVCVGRLDLKTLKREHRLARETNTTGEFYVKMYAIMKEISKYNKNQ